jgi:hypothetical protein
MRPRPHWATALALLCSLTVVFLIARDLFVPHIRDTEVWFGFELRGWLAWVTAPLHWLLFGLAAWGYWSLRPWVWPWASVYLFYIAVSHLVWNLTSPSGAGWNAGLLQLALFSAPALVVYWARPERSIAESITR